jgi:hypothetical protein
VNCNSQPRRTITIIVIIVFYYILSIALWFKFGRLWLGIVSFVPITLGLVLLFGSRCDTLDPTTNSNRLLDYSWVLVVGSFIAVAVYLVFVLTYRYSRNRILALVLALIVSFVISVVAWTIIDSIFKFPTTL